MVRIGLVAPRVARAIAIGAFGAVVMSGPVYAQAPSAFVFPGGASVIINLIKPDKAAEWEGVMQKIKDAMKASDKPERKAQADTWKIYKGAQPINNATVYFWVIEGAAKDGDYSVSKLMQELFPKEAVDLYKTYSDCYVSGHQIFQLTLVNDFAK